MLVLSRNRNESVVFPSLGISIEVVRISKGKVILGVEAPKVIPVHREEIAARISRETSCHGYRGST
jgi:carbon storage regulator